MVCVHRKDLNKVRVTAKESIHDWFRPPLHAFTYSHLFASAISFNFFLFFSRFMVEFINHLIKCVNNSHLHNINQIFCAKRHQGDVNASKSKLYESDC